MPTINLDGFDHDFLAPLKVAKTADTIFNAFANRAYPYNVGEYELITQNSPIANTVKDAIKLLINLEFVSIKNDRYNTYYEASKEMQKLLRGSNFYEYYYSRRKKMVEMKLKTHLLKSEGKLNNIEYLGFMRTLGLDDTESFRLKKDFIKALIIENDPELNTYDGIRLPNFKINLVQKVFISFSAEDKSLMKRLKSRIDKHIYLEAVVVDEKKEGLKNISEVVKMYIDNSNYFIPILTSKSVHTQWINQEIGYASSRDNLEIIPIVEDLIIRDLKGFIHNQIPLNFKFSIKLSDSKHTKSRKDTFRRCYNEVMNYINSKLPDE